MKNASLSPTAVWSILIVLVVAAAVGFWYFTSPTPQKVDLTQVKPEQLEDKDPPHRGQPGYRERITDPPSK